jgi:signal peptidase
VKHIGKIIENVIVGVSIVLILFFLAMIFLPRFDYGLIVIKSGSMEPTIKTGSAVIINKQDEYIVGDIITFANSTNELVTHRIVGVDEKGFFITKGDNNNTEDIFGVRENDIKGSVILTMFYVGYAIAFLQSGGIALLILVMGLYFVGKEILKYKRKSINKR